MPKVKVFVYGSLKRGFRNFAIMERVSGTFVGEAIIEGAYLRSLGPYPALILMETHPTDEPVSDWVFGEVFDVDERNIHILDSFEGTPDFYKRSEGVAQYIVRGEGLIGKTEEVFFYELAHPEQMDHQPVVRNGEWEEPKGAAA